MSAADPVTASVDLVLEPDGVRGVLRAQHTPDLPFSGWLGLAVAVDECRRAADRLGVPFAISSQPVRG